MVSDDMAAALPRGDQLWPVAQDTVAQWWATYGKHVPLLASVARLVLAQPCASAAERNWSVYGKIKNDTTSRMSHEVADKRVYCHEALHLKEKLQTASYNQEVVACGTPTRTRTRRTRRPTWPLERPRCCWLAAAVLYCGGGLSCGCWLFTSPRIRRVGGGGGEVNTAYSHFVEGQSKYVKYVLPM